jgi:hypothetical protein
MGDRNDHPLRADCSTCRFAGRDGDLGEVEVCDNPDDPRVDDWLDGKVGPCPGWKPAWWTDPVQMAELDAAIAADDAAEGQPEVADG